MKTTKTLGRIIREAILIQGLTQKQAAFVLNISPQTLSSYINDRRQPNIECFIKMIQLFGIDFSILFSPIPNDSIHQKDIILYYLIKQMDEKGKDVMIDMLQYCIPLTQLRNIIK